MDVLRGLGGLQTVGEVVDYLNSKLTGPPAADRP
jgi:hypothetical protein